MYAHSWSLQLDHFPIGHQYPPTSKLRLEYVSDFLCPAQALPRGSHMKSMGLSTLGLINDSEARNGVRVPPGLAHRASKAPGGSALTPGYMLLWWSPWGKGLGDKCHR